MIVRTISGLATQCTLCFWLALTFVMESALHGDHYYLDPVRLHACSPHMSRGGGEHSDRFPRFGSQAINVTSRASGSSQITWAQEGFELNGCLGTVARLAAQRPDSESKTTSVTYTRSGDLLLGFQVLPDGAWRNH